VDHVKSISRSEQRFDKLKQKKMAARYIELPPAPLSTEAPHGGTPAARFFFVDNTNIVKF
jgi:hypothetical protein